MRSSPRRCWCFAGQKFTPSGFLAFAKHFGKPEPHVIDQFHHPEHADILILSNVEKDGKPTGLADAGTYFHTDYSYLDVPARCTTLYSIQVPNKGGDTLFANQYAAYDDLLQSMKNRSRILLRCTITATATTRTRARAPSPRC